MKGSKRKLKAKVFVLRGFGRRVRGDDIGKPKRSHESQRIVENKDDSEAEKNEETKLDGGALPTTKSKDEKFSAGGLIRKASWAAGSANPAQ